MDSGSELKFAQLLDKYNIEWAKNCGAVAFKYKDSLEKERKYYPDFYLPKYDMWVEIKGRYYDNELTAYKLKAVGNIEIIYSDKIQLPSFINLAELTGIEPVGLRSDSPVF